MPTISIQLCVCVSTCFRILARYRAKMMRQKDRFECCQILTRKILRAAHLCYTKITVICFNAFFIAPLANAGRQAHSSRQLVFIHLLVCARHLTGSQLHFLCAIPALHAHFTCFFFFHNLHSHNWKRADVILESNFYLFHFVRFCIRAIWKILPSPAHRQVAFIFRDTLMYYSVCVCKFFVAVIAAVAIAIPPEEN